MITSSREAVPAKTQHRKPCHDCPWRRVALPRWLGGTLPLDWLGATHGEAVIECHTVTGGHQCAGAATYRANVCKTPRDPNALNLPADRKTVFASPAEFLEHHKEKE